jgi:ABC-2 type transport system ATP-binding protein
VDYAVEGFQLAKTFVKKRRVADLVRHPLRRAERIEALRGVDLRVRTGEIFGLLGPNGAGKTTLLKVLSCLVLPDRGRAVVLGEDTIHENRVKPKIGLVNTDERSFYWRLSGRENLRFFATLYDVEATRAESRVTELLERVGLGEAADQRFSDYSTGMKQRLSIARALLHDPPVLLMDEPTRSLDPAAALALRGFIKDELNRRAGKTVVLATHNLVEAEALCGRVAILVRGRIREVGTIPEIRRWGVRERRFRLELSRSLPGEIRERFQVLDEGQGDGAVRLTVVLDEAARLDELLRRLLGAGVGIQSCDRLEPDLEEAFSRILEREDGTP